MHLILLLKVLFLRFWMRMTRKHFIAHQWIHLGSPTNRSLDLDLPYRCHSKTLHSKNLKMILANKTPSGQCQEVHRNQR
jgi:hypothetical protein